MGLSTLALTLEHQPSTASDTTPVIRKTPKSISAPGEVRINGKTTIVPTPPKVTRTLIKPGDQVQEGQVIFLLPSYQSTMAKLQASFGDHSTKQDWHRLITSTKIKAPVSGQVLRIKPDVEIANPADFQVIAHIPSGKVKQGQTAIILCNQMELVGQVEDIQTDYATIELKDPSLALHLLDQPFKVKFIDDLQLASYN